MSDEDPRNIPADDAELEALLRAAGPRQQPSADVAADVRAAVAAEWRATVAAKQPRRRVVVPWLAAASVAAAAVGAWWLVPQLLPTAASVASVERLNGPVEYRHDGTDGWQALPASAELASGDEVRTSATGRVALRRADGLEIRLDAGSTVALVELDAARLEAGRVYVDSGRAGTSAAAFEVQTGFGTVRHLGTQYSVGLADQTLAVAVREGSVAVDRGHVPLVARAGERLTVQRDGQVQRSAIERHGAEWQWAQAVAPAFAIEGRTLDEFLVWAARETGSRLAYASTQAAREAEQTVLKGSVEGLTPEDAVGAVLTTTPSLEYRLAGGQLRIERTLP